VTSADTLTAPAVIASRERDVECLADRRRVCRFIGWTPVLNSVDAKRMVSDPGSPPT